MKSKKIKLFDPIIDIKEEVAIKDTLKSRFWASGAGTGKVEEFEERFREYIGSKSCVAVNSGTAALHLAVSLFNVKNKEVILPSLSFVSTAHAVMYNGGIPKFVDIDPDTLCIDPLKIEEAVSSKTEMILPVHFAGLPCDLKYLQKISKKNKIPIVEDAAHAAGTTYEDEKIGRHSEAVCFSFHPVKNLAMPTGGAITLNVKSKTLEDDLKSKRWCGITNRKGVTYDVKQIGWNFYMNEFSAAIGLEQLKKLDKMNQKRRETAKRYFDEIALSDKMPFDKKCSYHFYWIRVKNRTRFMKQMYKNGIETGIHYKPIHLMTAYKNKIKLPITELIAKEIVSLPTHPNMSEQEVTRVIQTVNKLVGNKL